MKSKKEILLVLLASSAGLGTYNSFGSEFTRQQFLGIQEIHDEDGNLSSKNIQFQQIEKFSSDSSPRNAISYNECDIPSPHSHPHVEEISSNEIDHADDVGSSRPATPPTLTTAIQRRTAPSVQITTPEYVPQPSVDTRRSSTFDLVSAAVGQSLQHTEADADVNIHLQNEKRAQDGSVNTFNIEISIQHRNQTMGKSTPNVLSLSNSTTQLPVISKRRNPTDVDSVAFFPKASFGNGPKAQEAPIIRRLARPFVFEGRRRSSLPQDGEQPQVKLYPTNEPRQNFFASSGALTSDAHLLADEGSNLQVLMLDNPASTSQNLHSVAFSEFSVSHENKIGNELVLAPSPLSSAPRIMPEAVLQWTFNPVFGDGCDLGDAHLANSAVFIPTGSLFLCGGLGNLSSVIRHQQKEKNTLGISHVGLIVVATSQEIMDLLDECKAHGGLYYNPRCQEHYDSMTKSLRRLNKHINKDQLEAFCVHSTGKHGVHIDPLQILLPKYHGNIFIRPRIKAPHTAHSLREVLLREIGKGYNANLSELKKATTGKNKGKKDPWTAFCSEVVAIIFIELGFLPQSLANNYTPASFCSSGEDILSEFFGSEISLKTIINYHEGSCCLIC